MFPSQHSSPSKFDSHPVYLYASIFKAAANTHDGSLKMANAPTSSRSSSRPTTPVLRPCIADLLRTGVYPPLLLLRVEKIAVVTVKEDINLSATSSALDADGRQTYRLWLGDGELMIQALLELQIMPIFVLEGISEGSLIEVTRYTVQSAKRTNGQGEVLFLGVTNYRVPSGSRPATAAKKEVRWDFSQEGGFVKEDVDVDSGKDGGFIEGVDVDIDAETELTSGKLKWDRNAREQVSAKLISSQGSDEGFETKHADPDVLARRRSVLHETVSNSASVFGRNEKTMPNPSKPFSHDATPFTSDRKPRVTPPPVSQHAMHVSTHSQPPITQYPLRPPQTQPHASFAGLASLLPPPLHGTRKSVPLPPFLAIISWVSQTIISKPNSPFPPKRHIKIHDLSTLDRNVGITVAVYEDALDFKPEAGTVAMLTGLVAQWWCSGGGKGGGVGWEVILNRYARRGRNQGEEESREGEWFVGDEEYLRKEEGMDEMIGRLRGWWLEKKRPVAIRGT